MLAAHGYATHHDFQMAFDVMLKDDGAIRLYEALGVPAARGDRASPQRRTHGAAADAHPAPRATI